MTTLQDYECPVHGRFEVTITGEVPDEVLCEAFLEPDPEVRRHWGSLSLCHAPCPWVPSATSIRTPETHAKAMADLARSTNPW